MSKPSDDKKDGVRACSDPWQKIHISYEDEFAPSRAEILAERLADPTELQKPRARLVFYNQHLIDQLEVVMNEAALLGCPPLQVPLPVLWLHIEHSEWQQIMETVSVISDKYPEGSAEWLVLHCYMHVVTASHYVTFGAPSPVVAEKMIRVGGALRELELVRLNKAHARRGRRNRAAAAQGARVRNQVEAAKHQATLAEMKRRIDKGEKLVNAARFAFKAGYGTSPQANLRLWARHRKK